MPNHIKDSRGSLLRWWCARIPKNSHSKSCVFPSQPAVRIMKTVPPLKKIVDRQNNQRKMIVHCSLFSSFFLHLLGSNTAGGSKQWSHWCHQQRHSGLQLVWFWMGDHYKDLCFYRVLHGFFRSCARMRLTFARFGKDCFFFVWSVVEDVAVTCRI